MRERQRDREAMPFTVDSKAADRLALCAPGEAGTFAVSRKRRLMRIVLAVLTLCYAGLSCVRAVQHVLWLLNERPEGFFKEIPMLLHQNEAQAFNQVINRILNIRAGFIVAGALLAFFTAVGVLLFLSGRRKPLRVVLRFQSLVWFAQALTDLVITAYVYSFLVYYRFSAADLGTVSLIGAVIALCHGVTGLFFASVRKLPTVGGRTKHPLRAAKLVHWTVPAVLLVQLFPIIAGGVVGDAFGWLFGALGRSSSTFTNTFTGWLQDVSEAVSHDLTSAGSMYVIDTFRIVSGAVCCAVVYIICFGVPRGYPQPQRPIAGRRGASHGDKTARGEKDDRKREPKKLATMRPTGSVFNGDEKKDEGRRPWGHGLD